jgi:2-dehydropantoate 2-reductase
MPPSSTMRETVVVAEAEGVRLATDAVERYLQVSRGMGEVKTSMWQDLEHGRPTEIADMNGQIVELAARHGLPVPVNAMLASLIRAAEGAAAH